MIFLIHHIRKIVLSLSLFLALVVFLLYQGSYITISKAIQFYALAAISFLYVALLVSPIYSVFTNLPLKPLLVKARRAIGLSAFILGLLHGSLAFFGSLGGFSGLTFYSSRYLLAFSLGFAALLILTLMASISFDWAVKKLGTKWKLIHRLVYLAAILIIVHALRLGSHFSDLNAPIAQFFIVAIGFLAVLEIIRFDKFISSKLNQVPKYAFSLIVIPVFIISCYLYLDQQTKNGTLSLHAQHQQIAQQGLTGQGSFARNDKYKVDFSASNKNSVLEKELIFKITDSKTGKPTTFFQIVYEKVAHLIVLDSELKYFDHIHPVQSGNEFRINYKFPTEGQYYLYLDFQPVGERFEQNTRVTLPIGTIKPKLASQKVDTNLIKTFGNYQVKLTTGGNLQAKDLTAGKQKISFTVNSASTKEPITNLKPYLGSFGHLVMINQESYEYLHIHPAVTTPPPPGSSGGPVVEFLPIGIYGPFKPGIYRTFGQFNHNGNLFVADFTVKVN